MSSKVFIHRKFIIQSDRQSRGPDCNRPSAVQAPADQVGHGQDMAMRRASAAAKLTNEPCDENARSDRLDMASRRMKRDKDSHKSFSKLPPKADGILKSTNTGPCPRLECLIPKRACAVHAAAPR
jgi:hypothetical protein